VAAKLDLRGKSRFSGAAIFGALVGKANATGARELGGGFQGGTAQGFWVGTSHGHDLASVDFEWAPLDYKTFRQALIRHSGGLFCSAASYPFDVIIRESG
jgi:hypothetical protein